CLVREPSRVQTGLKKRLICVDVAHPGHDALIQEKCLQAPSRRRQALAPVFGVEVEWLGPESGLLEKPLYLLPGIEQGCAAETADVPEAQLSLTALKAQDQ